MNCRCLNDPEPIPGGPDGGVEPPDTGQPSSPPDAGSATSCQHVTCDPGKVCTHWLLLLCGARVDGIPQGVDALVEGEDEGGGSEAPERETAAN